MPTNEVLNQILADDPTVELMSLYANDEASTEVVATRKMMYLPLKYAALGLAMPIMTPWQAWN